MTKPEEKPLTESPSEEDEPSAADMDEVVTESFDKTLKLHKGAPPLYPPGVSASSLSDGDL